LDVDQMSLSSSIPKPPVAADSDGQSAGILHTARGRSGTLGRYGSGAGQITMADPRVYFAAERTLLAWVRSGITVMALGFVVARFGLFLTLMSASRVSPAGGHHSHWPSSALGIALVVLGAGAILGALQNHRLYVRTLPMEDLPKLSIPWLTPFLAGSVAAVGLLLAVYLVVT
jgi:putative membrane protein